MSKLCEDKLCEDKLCVSKLCVRKLCVDKLCVSKLCVDKLCVSKLCVEGGRADGGRTGGRRDTEPKTRTPHKDVGKNIKKHRQQGTEGALKPWISASPGRERIRPRKSLVRRISGDSPRKNLEDMKRYNLHQLTTGSAQRYPKVS